jgi:hypothetical protein
MTPETPPSGPNGNVYEMLWKCDFCGTDKLLGKSQRFCPNCGAPQNPASRYFPLQAEAVAASNYRYLGADVLCPACNTANAAQSGFCAQCGAPLNDAAKVKLKADGALPVARAIPAKKRSVVLALIVAVLILGAGIFALDFFWRKDMTLQLASSEWRREIKIEQLQALHDSAWCDAVPGDAYGVSSSSEIRSYRKIADGESCTTERVDQGDGTFATRQHCETRYREDPVYDRKCYFTVNRWRYARSLTATGNDREPHYPQLQLLNPGNCLGCEREAQRVAGYFLHLTAVAGDAAPYRCETSESVWWQAAQQSLWTVKIGMLSGKTHCDTLEPKKIDFTPQ